jgi:hypothetical protein
VPALYKPSPARPGQIRSRITRNSLDWLKSCKLAQNCDWEPLLEAWSWPKNWVNPVNYSMSNQVLRSMMAAATGPCRQLLAAAASLPEPAAARLPAEELLGRARLAVPDLGELVPRRPPHPHCPALSALPARDEAPPLQVLDHSDAALSTALGLATAPPALERCGCEQTISLPSAVCLTAFATARLLAPPSPATTEALLYTSAAQVCTRLRCLCSNVPPLPHGMYYRDCVWAPPSGGAPPGMERATRPHRSFMHVPCCCTPRSA